MLPIPLLILLLTFGHFLGAVDLDRDIQGNVYVVDRAANTLVKLSPRGDSIRSVSGFGSGELQFDSPSAVCARRGNDVYVADYNNHRIQRFNRMLDYVTTIYTRDDPDRSKRFGYPRDVAVSRQGDLFIVDGENRRIVRVNPFGQVLRSFGDVTAGAGRLVDPEMVEVDEEDNAYVLDGGRVVVFDPFGSYLRDFGGSEGRAIRSIAVDNDTLLLADSATVRLIDLATLSSAGIDALPAPAASVRYANGRFVAVEEKRIVVYGREESR